MKTIIVKWTKEESIYGKSMIIVYSDHDSFRVGFRFDFGFFKIATDEGYTIISLPLDKQ